MLVRLPILHLMHINSLTRHFSSMFHDKCLLPRLDKLLLIRSLLNYFYQCMINCQLWLHFFSFLRTIKFPYQKFNSQRCLHNSVPMCHLPQYIEWGLSSFIFIGFGLQKFIAVIEPNKISDIVSFYTANFTP